MGQSAHLRTPVEMQVLPPVVNSCNSRLLWFDVFNNIGYLDPLSPGSKQMKHLGQY
jgi:hypothetical protein